MHYLSTQVPMNFAAIPEQEISVACERFNLSLDIWVRQERAFGLMKKVYASHSAQGESNLFRVNPEKVLRRKRKNV
ncbi:MAG: hypothetical protein ACR2MF_06975 [Chthoniobacterales bacterium]